MIFVVSVTAFADVPLPIYPECGEDSQVELCPPEIQGDWHLYSIIPESSLDTVRAARRRGCYARTTGLLNTGQRSSGGVQAR